MIKYNTIKYNRKTICVISDEEWYDDMLNKTMIPHRNCEWEEKISTDIKRPYFTEEGTEKFLKRVTEFKEDEKILPYLINRFGLSNIYVRYNNKTVSLLSNHNLYKGLEREEKLNKILKNLNKS